MSKRGTVVRVRFDPVAGSEQRGERPALVVSPTIMNERSTVVIVAPITSRKMERVYPFEARLNHERCGLSMPSKAMINQIRAIDKARIVSVLGQIDSETQAEVDEALSIAVGLTDLE